MKDALAIFFILGSFLLSSCSSSTLHIDPSLIRPYAYADQSAEPFEAPYVSVFSRADKTLVYLAAHHENLASGPTHKTVEAAIQKFKPNLVIIEGIQTSMGLSPYRYPDHPEDCARPGISSCSEAEYAAVLSKKAAIPFTGGEPDEKDILESVRARGYSPKDLIAFYTLRQVPQWVREGSWESGHAQTKIERFVSYYERILATRTGLTLSELHSWYHERLGRELDLDRLTAEDLAPISGENTTYLNRLSVEVGAARNLHLARLIESSINRYQNVLIVYGAGHLVSGRSMLNEAFSKSRDQKFF
jgi:hypothetical protein